MLSCSIAAVIIVCKYLMSRTHTPDIINVAVFSSIFWKSVYGTPTLSSLSVSFSMTPGEFCIYQWKYRILNDWHKWNLFDSIHLFYLFQFVQYRLVFITASVLLYYLCIHNKSQDMMMRYFNHIQSCTAVFWVQSDNWKLNILSLILIQHDDLMHRITCIHTVYSTGSDEVREMKII